MRRNLPSSRWREMARRMAVVPWLQRRSRAAERIRNTRSLRQARRQFSDAGGAALCSEKSATNLRTPLHLPSGYKGRDRQAVSSIGENTRRTTTHNVGIREHFNIYPIFLLVPCSPYTEPLGAPVKRLLVCDAYLQRERGWELILGHPP